MHKSNTPVYSKILFCFSFEKRNFKKTNNLVCKSIISITKSYCLTTLNLVFQIYVNALTYVDM